MTGKLTYALHVLAALRSKPLDAEIVQSIISGTKMSGLNIAGETYSEHEFDLLEKTGHFLHIGQQIIVASHTALEAYLKQKFEEYYEHKLSGVGKRITDASLSRFRFRTLDDSKKAYWECFQIHIPSFDIDFYSYENCNFQPESSWEALSLIYKARNEIVHLGECRAFKIVTLMDSWYPFDFVRRWVSLFDVNCDSWVYKGRRNKLFLAHDERARHGGLSI